MKKKLTNEQIVEALQKQAGQDNPNQFAEYLAKKYQVKMTRQQIRQFTQSNSTTITILLLREACENHPLITKPIKNSNNKEQEDWVSK